MGSSSPKRGWEFYFFNYCINSLTISPVVPKHYDTTKEIRTLGTSHYKFSHNATERQKEMAALKAARAQTMKDRKVTEEKKESRKRALEDRRALLLGKKKQRAMSATSSTPVNASEEATVVDDVNGFLESLS